MKSITTQEVLDSTVKIVNYLKTQPLIHTPEVHIIRGKWYLEHLPGSYWGVCMCPGTVIAIAQDIPNYFTKAWDNAHIVDILHTLYGPAYISGFVGGVDHSQVPYGFFDQIIESWETNAEGYLRGFWDGAKVAYDLWYDFDSRRVS